MSQTSYSITAPVAVQGQLEGVSDGYMIDSFANEESGGLEAGRPLVRGTAANQVLLPSGAADEFLGVSVFQQAIQNEDLTGDFMFADGETVGVLTRGKIWVTVEEAVATTDDVYWRHTVNGGLIPGGWRTDADTANAVQVTQAKWLTAAAQDGLALLSINLP